MPLTIGILVIANSEFMKILQSNQICTVNNIRASSSLTISYGHKANRQFFRKNSDVTYLRSTLFPVIIILGFAFHADEPGRISPPTPGACLRWQAPLSSLKGAAFYVFLLAILVWNEVAALRLNQTRR